MHVLHSLDPGGMENGVVNISNGLDPEEFRSSIVCIRSSGAFAERLKDTVSVHSLQKRDKFDWRVVKRLREHIIDSKPDVLHSHNLGALIYSALANFGVSAGPSIIHGEHGELWPNETTPRQCLIRRIFYRRCKIIHGVSRGLATSLEALPLGLEEGQVKTILNGVDCENFRPHCDAEISQLREEHGLPPGGPIIGNFGSFNRNKNHGLLIEAFEILAEFDPTVVLLLVGDGGHIQDKVRARGLGSRFADRIVFAGFQLDPSPWYAVIDVLVLPSMYEGLSNAMLEAMASGVPCLACPACGAGEVIDSEFNGILADMPNAQVLATTIQGMLNDQARLKQLAEKARITAEEKFSLSGMVENYAAVYRECAVCALQAKVANN